MTAAMQMWASGDRQGAVALAEQVIAKAPYHPRANELVAAACAEAGQWEQAAERLTAALKGEPANPDLHFALACARGHQGDVAGAAAAFGRALEVAPGYSQAVTPLAIALMELGKSSEAEAVLRRGLSRNPGDVDGATVLAAVLADRAQVAEAIELLRGPLSAHPGDPAILGIVRQWLTYLDETGEGEAKELRERFGRIVGRGDRVDPIDRGPERPLRIGYLSPDFKRHSVAYFFEPLLQHHDRRSARTFCYSTGSTEDEVTRRLKALAGEWRACHAMDDAGLIATIRNDGIDILVELSGITTGNRLSALARRAAPIQMTYIGCPSSTGVPAIDYRIVDEVTDPPGSELHATERLIRMPGCFLAYRPPEMAPEVGPPPCLGIGAPIVFGSFNNLAKVSPGTAQLWASVLRVVPGSVLAFKGKALGDSVARAAVQQGLVAAGIPADRLRLLGDIPDMRGHLAAYGQIDIGLDPTPYNGTTTMCEALWMGVPVVSLKGKLHAGRVGASLLGAVGRDGWVAESEAEYVAKAASLASNRERLAELRSGQREMMRESRLCDGAGHTRALEGVYRKVWRERVGMG